MIDIPMDESTGKYAYAEVVQVNADPEQSYSNTKAWLTKRFLDGKVVVDEPPTRLVDKGHFPVNSTMNAGMGIKMVFSYTVTFDVILEFKEGRYRYQLTNIVLSQSSEAGTEQQTLEAFVKSQEQMGMGKKKMGTFVEDTCKLIHEEFGKFVPELKQAVLTGPSDNDW